MTTTLTKPDAPDTRPKPRTSWWRRPWVAPLSVVAVAFLVLSVPRYLTLDPTRSRVPAPAGFPVHFPLLVGHVVFGSVAMLTCCLQIWPWFRQRYPKAHRVLGRVYVLGGVLPGGLLALAVGSISPFGPATAASDVLLALVWLGCTGAGFVAARRRRFGAHRRWMVRSFALTMSIILNRLWGVAAAVLLAPHAAELFHGSDVAFGQSVAALAAWLGWVPTLLAAEWWLERRNRRRA